MDRRVRLRSPVARSAHPCLGDAHPEGLTDAFAFDFIGHDGNEDGDVAVNGDVDVVKVLGVPGQVAARVAGDIALAVEHLASMSRPPQLGVMQGS